MSLLEFKKRFVHMDVLCVKRHLDLTLAGIGSDLFVYSNDGSLLFSRQIFTGERIHSIVVRNDLILLKGGKQLCLIKAKDKWDIISEIQCCDWVQDVVMLEDRLVGLVTAHNFFECWDLGSRKLLSGYSCDEKCILYSCKIIGDSLESLVIFAGTVFGDVVIWGPILKEDAILQRLKAHNGAVFSIEVNPPLKLLTTTSDDRSLKIWSVITPTTLLHPTDWKQSSIQLIHTLFGHTARVWRSLIIHNYYLTIGEDSQLIVWGNDGRMIKTLTLHQESGIRGLDFNQNFITTGGEDGGINTISLKHLTSENEAAELLNIGCSKVCYTQNNIVYCVNGACVLLTESGEEILYKNEIFSSYCLLEVSVGGEYIILGSIKGHIVVIETKSRVVFVEKQILSGRVYSVHWVDPILVTCGPDGELDLWEVSQQGLINKAKKVLPHSKERWTTCGVLCNGSLIIGDRMGNIYIYDIKGGENPVKSFRKIHSHLGVTDISVLNECWVSIGRDGTLKQFCDLDILKTSKLPMDWPWKIVRWKIDTLILGFHSVCFIVWSMKHREVIASHNCGGGHRSCDYKLNNNKLSFLYVKDKKVYEVDLDLGGVTRVRTGFHGKEINCLKILQTDPMVVVTGSEDTTLRVTRIGDSENHVEVLKSHVSSIRDVYVSSTRVVSVGGKGQIIIWEFDVRNLKFREVVNHRLMKETRNWKSPVVSIDPEMRIMSVDVLERDECLVAIGCSDCRIRIFTHGEEFREVCTIPYTHCVLNVAFLPVSMRVLVSMGTDGRVVFWDVNNLPDVKRIHEVKLHQSGVNSFDLTEIESGRFIFATGGDDNKICVTYLEVMNGIVKTKRVWENSTTHSCQITGVKIIKNYLLTTSIDQRITIWKWSWHEGEFKSEFLHQRMTAVPDVQGVDTTWVGNSIVVAVYGKGIEIYHVNLM